MTIASNPPIDLPLESLTTRQKWDLYQTLREELEPQIDPQVPEWHMGVLEERERKWQSGEVEFLEMDEVVRRLEAKFR